MPKFKIACTWESCGEFEVEANSFEEAWKIAKEMEGEVPLPKESEYVDGSFYLSRDMSEALNGLIGN